MKSKHPVALLFMASTGVLAGCATQQIYLEGIGPGGEMAPDVRYVLESAEGLEGTITVHAAGWRRNEVGGRTTDTVKFTVVIDNASQDPIALPVDTFVAMDDEQRSFRRLEMALPPGGTVENVTVGPRERTSVDLLFDAGGPGALRSAGSVTLQWAYSFRGESFRHRSRFLPVRYSRSTMHYHTGFYYGPGFYYGFGPAWYW